MTENYLHCPDCGSVALKSMETASVDYPVRIHLNGQVEYGFGEYQVYDEGTKYEDDLWCSDCDWNGSKAELVATEDES